MNWQSTLVLVIVASFIALFIPKKGRLYYLFAWLLKIIAALLLGVIYQKFYNTGDTFSLFADGQQLFRLAQENFTDYINALIDTLRGNRSEFTSSLSNQNPRAVLMAFFNSFLIVVVGNNYWFVAILAATINFVITVYLVNFLHENYKIALTRLFIAFFLFPSVCFWSSGLLKENVLSSGLYLSLLMILSFTRKGSLLKNRLLLILNFLLLPILFYVLFRLKYYYIAVFAPITFAYVLNSFIPFGQWQKSLNHTKFKSVNVQISFVIIIGFAMMLIASFAHPNLNFENLYKAVVQNNYKMANETQDEANLITYNNLIPTWQSILSNLPSAYWQGLARPYVWEKGHLFKRLVAAENLLVCFLIGRFLFSLLCRKQTFRYPIEGFSILVYVMVMMSLLVLAVPNLGTLARYKVGFLPFLLLVILPNLPIPNATKRIMSLLNNKLFH